VRDHPFSRADGRFSSVPLLFFFIFSILSTEKEEERRRGEEEGKEEGARLEKERNHISNQPLVPEKWSWLEKGPQTSRTINACVCVILQQNGRQF